VYFFYRFKKKVNVLAVHRSHSAVVNLNNTPTFSFVSHSRLCSKHSFASGPPLSQQLSDVFFYVSTPLSQTHVFLIFFFFSHLPFPRKHSSVSHPALPHNYFRQPQPPTRCSLKEFSTSVTSSQPPLSQRRFSTVIILTSISTCSCPQTPPSALHHCQ